MNKEERLKNLQKDRLLSSFLKRLIRESEDQVCKVMAFGSRAKGMAGPGSDYDILLVLKKKKRDNRPSLWHRLRLPDKRRGRYLLEDLHRERFQ